MIDVKSLHKEMQAKYAEVDAARKVLDEAKTDEEQSTAREIYEQKANEFDALNAKVDEAEKDARRQAMLAQVAEMTKPATSDGAKVVRSGIGGVVGGRERPAENFELEVDAHRDAFTMWMQGKDRHLSDRQRELLIPKSERVRQILDKSSDPDAGKSVVVPPTLAMRIMGSNYAREFGVFQKIHGKTILSLNDATLNPSLAHNLVPQEFRAQLNMLPFDEPTVLDKVTMIPSTTGTVTFPGLAQADSNEFGGVAFSWTQEGGEKSETEPEFEQLEIACYELSGYTEISERALSRSAIPLESLLASLFKPALNFTLDNAIINGSGTGQPTGILNTAGIRTVARTTAGSVGRTDLIHLKHLVKPAHRGNARYALGDDVEESLELATVSNTDQRPLFTENPSYGPYVRLAGYPYDVAQNCPTLGTQGDVIFGNFKWYFLVMEEEITIARSEHYQFRNNVIAYKVYVVVGGRVMQPRAFAILADEQS